MLTIEELEILKATMIEEINSEIESSPEDKESMIEGVQSYHAMILAALRVKNGGES